MRKLKRPVIGVLPLYDMKRESLWMLPGYMQGIEAAGGIPAILSISAEKKDIAYWVDTLDGFLFTGGQDVQPLLYGEEKMPFCDEVCVQRDELESVLFQLACERDKPVFGICRGLQIMNALLGGTLYQDIPSQMEADKKIVHAQKAPYTIPCHRVELAGDSPLGKRLGSGALMVNSLHHQGIKRLAEGLQASAMAEDGLVEAAYMPDKSFVTAVQWHPECSLGEDGPSMQLFSSFVDAAKNK